VSISHLRSPEQEPEAAELHEALQRENDQLRTALATRIVIEQAKGMLAQRLGMQVDDAFECLRREARNRRMKLHVLAAAVTAREAWTDAIFPALEAAEHETRRDTAEGGRSRLTELRPARSLSPVPRRTHGTEGEQ
jgi:hypothetical protein